MTYGSLSQSVDPRRYAKTYAADIEEHALKLVVLLRRDGKQAGGPVSRILSNCTIYDNARLSH